MEEQVIIKNLEEIKEKLEKLWISFDIDNKNMEVAKLEERMSSANFWDDKEEANKVIEQLNDLKNITVSINELKSEIDDSLELINMGVEIDETISSSVKSLMKRMDQLEIAMLLDGEYDRGNCFLEIHSGAGGTEACDWAEMLFRMYSRYCEKNNYKYDILDYLPGDEAGLKTVTMYIKGKYSYGYLKNEKGIHRLVRISPFDSNKRRHTSFASVDIMPELDDSIEVEINDKDIRIDVFRSSGKGGQGVNTTDSAVRITHLPTGIVVTCQNERSQIQNKEQCMKMLKNKLYLLEEEKKKEEFSKIKGNVKNIDFGSQIRSYVMHPYSMVKDHRNKTETSNVDRVLDGDLDIFIEAELRG